MADPNYPDEEWRTIARAPYFAVSNYGRIKRAVPGAKRSQAGRLRKLYTHKTSGYVHINLQIAIGREKTLSVHRLVCEAFHGPPPSPAHESAHWDGNPSNNRADNLRWATPSENSYDRTRHGRNNRRCGSTNSNSNTTEDIVRAIRSVPRYAGILDDLAAKYGISRNKVAVLRTRTIRFWPHVPFPGPYQGRRARKALK